MFYIENADRVERGRATIRFTKIRVRDDIVRALDDRVDHKQSEYGALDRDQPLSLYDVRCR